MHSFVFFVPLCLLQFNIIIHYAGTKHNVLRNEAAYVLYKWRRTCRKVDHPVRNDIYIRMTAL